MPNTIIRQAISVDDKFLRAGIETFWLDDTGYETGQFLIAEVSGERAGFGRVREHESCSEMCTLGVVEALRQKNVATDLIKALIQKAEKKSALYLVCVIPGLFIPLGFSIVSEYPEPIKEKLERCETTMSVAEKYVVMKYSFTSKV
jgi:N-acetylglutamate synthase-like GNAT family acetyltransferase